MLSYSHYVVPQKLFNYVYHFLYFSTAWYCKEMKFLPQSLFRFPSELDVISCLSLPSALHKACCISRINCCLKLHDVIVTLMSFLLLSSFISSICLRLGFQLYLFPKCISFYDTIGSFDDFLRDLLQMETILCISVRRPPTMSYVDVARVLGNLYLQLGFH